MKAFTKITVFFIAIFMATSFLFAQSQIDFQGLYSEGEGGAAWNADGSGPEPYGNGHSDVYYYTASRDYVDPTSSSGAHMLDNMNGFPLFEQALMDNGFTAEQLTLKISLSSMGEDIEGSDWFTLGNVGYANFYPAIGTFDLAGAALFEVIGNYAIYISGPGSQEFESGYLRVNNIAGNSPDPVKNVAAALFADLANEEFKFYMQVTNAAVLSGNGRSGGYFNVNCSFVKGLPTLPFQGLYADNEGTAGWNADGTGPEPYGNGHGDIVYYSASVDYDGINPDPDACLAHVIEGSDGFFNTMLQLQYRGYSVGDLKLKMGLCSLGPDVFGEDWGYENGYQWLNEYNNSFTIELNGEPIIEYLQDTNKMTFINPGTVTWSTFSSAGKVYNISNNASTEAQFVAQSFLKDLGSHYLVTDVQDIHYVGPMPSGNGRSGVYYELGGGAMIGVHENATFIPEGPVSGTWTVESSPYYVDGHLEIANGQTLTIEPGVKVAVRGPYHFIVQGCVKAEGTADENIVFTRSNPNLWWDGFDYDYTPATNDNSVFQHCIFKYSSAQGDYPYNSGGVFAVGEFNKLLIDHCIFHSNEALIISASYYAGGGAIALWTASPVIRYSEFYNNHAMFSGAILCYENSNPEISRNLFYNNSSTTSDGGAIEIWNSSPDVVNNTFSLNNAYSNGGAVDIYSTSKPVFVNNIFWGNTANTGNQISITSNDCDVDFKYNDIEGGQAGISPYGIGNGVYENNIDADPLFVDITNFNFLLDNVTPSPCINAGDPTSPPDPDSSRSDMGCYQQDISTGLNDQHNFGMSAEIFPNPFTENLTISFEIKNTSEVTIEIFNAIGEKVEIISQSNLQPGKHTLTWQNALLPEGIYFLRLQTGTGSFIQKIVKTK